MRRRTRRIAGIFALVAMTFALTETVIAATCAPGMDMGAMETQVSEADVMPGGSHDDHRRDGDEADCPFGPASAVQGCAGMAVLPTHTARAVSSSGALTGSVSTEQTRQDLLLVKALFHPPRV